MRKDQLLISMLSIFVFLTGCASNRYANPSESHQIVTNDARFDQNWGARLPTHLDTQGKKTVLVDPNAHAWGAYDKNGELLRAGIATAGGTRCPPDAEDESECRTSAGTFHITALGGEDCISKKYPRPNGGGLMPYCMYFNKGQALHGSPDNIVVEDNISHGCVRMRIPDAEWVYTHFANVGTKVVVVPYNENS